MEANSCKTGLYEDLRVFAELSPTRREQLSLPFVLRSASINVLRKFIVITLLAIFGLPFGASLFALTPKSEPNLPACCRRGGEHHCNLGVAERAESLTDTSLLLRWESAHSLPERLPFPRIHISSGRPKVESSSHI